MRGTAKGAGFESWRGGKQLRAAEMNDGFQMKGLGEKIDEGDGLDLIAGADKSAEIAGKGGGVAGDVDQHRGPDGQIGRAHV